MEREDFYLNSHMEELYYELYSSSDMHIATFYSKMYAELVRDILNNKGSVTTIK